MTIRSYPKVWNLGHANISELLRDPVLVEEKIDGSQFGFGVIDGALCCRSRGQQIVLDAPGMFDQAVNTAKALAPKLVPGHIYRAEYLRIPRHNSLTYGRVPSGHLILFDVETGIAKFLDYQAKRAEAERLGLECVPAMFYGQLTDVEMLAKMLENTSCLGAAPIEGVVVKNYGRFGQDGHALMGKHVSETFKEEHRKSWKTNNPQKNDVLEMLCEMFRTEARWRKAIERMRDEGRLTSSPTDIGPAMKEIAKDVEVECEIPVRDALWKWARPHLMRRSTAGFPEWYKQQLMARQFAEGGVDGSSEESAG